MLREISRVTAACCSTLWATASITILLSILLHGATVTPVLRVLDRRSGRDTESAQLGLPLPS